jgi:hypothetical protein
MMRKFAIGLTLLAFSVHGAAWSTTASNDALDSDFTDEARPAGVSPARPAAPAESVTKVRVVAPPAAPVPTPSANPLWGIPLSRLSGTRDRPIFSPSRRPLSVAVAAEPVVAKPPPPRKKEIEPPPLALVGTIVGGEEGFGIFIDQATKDALRLKLGEDFQGWKLRVIQGREVSMEKDQRTAVLKLPEPGGSPSGGEVRLLPVSAVTQR